MRFKVGCWEFCFTFFLIKLWKSYLFLIVLNILSCSRTLKVKKQNGSFKFIVIFSYLSNRMKDFKSLTLWSLFHLCKPLTQFFSSQDAFFSSVLLGLNFNWNFSFPQCTLKCQMRERERSSIFLMDGGVRSKGLCLANSESAPSSVVYILIHHHALQI